MPTENQIHDVRPLAAPITAEDLLRLPSAGSSTLNGLRENIFVVLEYTKAWLKGIGCIPLHNKVS
jgi:malate synthase